jgi:hypothetical protein
MYLAQFATDQRGFLTAAIKWTIWGDAIVPADWVRTLLAVDGIDVALRLGLGSSPPEAILFLSCVAEKEALLRELGETLLSAAGRPRQAIVPSAAEEFDAIVGGLPAWQVRVNHESYRHDGHGLACNFRLYSTACDRRDASRIHYQVYLRSYHPEVETVRQVKKYQAWLDVERPFTPVVREMQRSLTSRLLEPGWISAEFVAIDEAAAKRWLDRVQANFGESMGRAGFAQAPLEVGDFGDWLMTGIHPCSDLDTDTDLVHRGASLFKREEVAWLLNGGFARPRVGANSSASAGATRPVVFISYASEDFVQASAVCSQLEGNGIPCWMAPRDIEKESIPYPEAIAQALSLVRAVVVVVSQAANQSVHIPRELDLALEGKLTLIPIRIENVQPGGPLNYLLRTCQWLNAYKLDSETAMNELLLRLRHLLGSQGIGTGPGRHGSI